LAGHIDSLDVLDMVRYAYHSKPTPPHHRISMVRVNVA